MALGHCLPRLYAMAEEYGQDSRITFGVVQASPGSSNTVPGKLEFTVDIRHPEASHYQAMLQGYEAIIQDAARQFGLEMEFECFWEAPGITFDSECIEAVQQAVDALGYSHRKMVSGAGHDASNVAKVAPTSMIFIPCKDGLSHNEKEAIIPADAVAGANILLHAMTGLAEIIA
jgi:N-carbamoyl-L-amino-acid hydrolase